MVEVIPLRWKSNSWKLRLLFLGVIAMPLGSKLNVSNLILSFQRSVCYAHFAQRAQSRVPNLKLQEHGLGYCPKNLLHFSYVWRIIPGIGEIYL